MIRIRKFLVAHSGNPRPSSYPYVSGDTFRAIADHIHDDLKTVDTSKVKEADIIFVKISYIKEFFEKIHPHIKFPYKLITHNGDILIDEKLSTYADEKIIKWYGQNVTINHPRIVPLPIGLENISYCNSGLPKYFNRLRIKSLPKKNRILFGFNIMTNKEKRQQAENVLLFLPVADKIQGWPGAKKYLELAASYAFVASPEGNGIDCHRTWEALYLGAVPIVTSSPVTEHFKSIGFPLFVIKDWKELCGLTENDLKKKYHELQDSFDKSLLRADYWFNLICPKK